MPPWIDDKHKMEMRDQLVCVGKDTFFPNGVESHLFVAFSPNTADCTVLKKCCYVGKNLHTSWQPVMTGDYVIGFAWKKLKNQRRDYTHTLCLLFSHVT